MNQVERVQHDEERPGVEASGPRRRNPLTGITTPSVRCADRRARAMTRSE